MTTASWPSLSGRKVSKLAPSSTDDDDDPSRG
jgi:hypothetical protein